MKDLGVTTDEIDNMDINDLQANFLSLMSTVVTAYGDDKEVEGTQEEEVISAK